MALFVGAVHKSSRGADERERRFQNPVEKTPIIIPAGRVPLLLGLWDEDPMVSVARPVLVAADPYRREGRETRVSIFERLEVLQHAVERGWAEGVSKSGEPIVCFHPALLPVYLEMVRHDVPLKPTEILTVIDAAGLNDDVTDEPAERARRATTALVRSRKFRRDVVDAYDGLCAMCGFDLGLVVGAHIYPVEAPGSPDKVWNGVALCGNHHAAFDAHLLWVRPEDRRIGAHPALIADSAKRTATAKFLETTRSTLQEPTIRSSRPKDEMLIRRYEHYGEKYNWLPAVELL